MRFANDSERTVIVGATGSGKTQSALYQLSNRRYDQRPWIIYNYKCDKSIDNIPYAVHMNTDDMPTQPGIYIVHPHPDDTEEVQAQMWEIWRREDIGVYIDEGFMVGRNNRAFRALLTQGRSKNIPIITLSQRPVWLDVFVFSEADFYQIFRLNYKEDIKNVGKFVDGDITQKLPKYFSYYYEVGEDALSRLQPVPSIESIHKTFASRLKSISERRKLVV